MMESRLYRERETETTPWWESPLLASSSGLLSQWEQLPPGMGSGVSDSQIGTSAARVGGTSSAPSSSPLLSVTRN